MNIYKNNQYFARNINLFHICKEKGLFFLTCKISSIDVNVGLLENSVFTLVDSAGFSNEVLMNSERVKRSYAFAGP